MTEICLHGRFGQPVGELARKIGNYALKNGYHAQVFNAFAAVRPGAPTFSVVRVDQNNILERSAPDVNPDVVVVLDNSLFTAANVFKGLKKGSVVMALGVSSEVMGEKSEEFRFEPLDPYFSQAGSSIETNLINGLKKIGVFD